MADSDGLSEWPKEHVPDADLLYMWVHYRHQTEGQLDAGAFRDRDGGMSTFWSRYITAEDALQMAKKPKENGIIGFTAGSVKSIPGLSVEHTPQPGNRAHVDVIGTKDAQARVELGRIARWIILPPGVPSL